jgi:hypothetical protein
LRNPKIQMRVKSVCVFAVSLLVAGTASAKICKTVGPDGSVTYTDRPTASCGADAPIETQSPAPAPASTATSGGAKKATRTSPSTDSAEHAVDSGRDAGAVEKAVIGIMGLEDLVQRSYDVCVSVLPTSMGRYGAAADGWRDRNASATAKMRRALSMTFNATQQRLMAEGVHVRNQQQLAPILASPKASQIKWCDQTANEIEARALDAKENLTTPLASY